MQPIVGHSVVSLFAGIGGFDLGFQRAGFRIAAHVEKDDNCLKLLSAKWPDAVALDDVCTAGAHNLPRCDVVTFGFPCQDLSVAGKRAGLAGGRSGLFYEATRIINEIKPAYCLFENVPGLLSSHGGRDFARVLMEMDRIGYCGAWRVLDAQWFGVAQRRRRVFGLFSCLDSGAERCAEILSLQESLRGHPAPSREAGEGTTRGFETGPQGGRFTDLAPTIDCRAKDGPIRNQLGVGAMVPAVAGCLLERDTKGADSDTKPGHLVPAYGFGGESDASSLSGAGDLQPPVTGRHGAPGFVAFQPRYFTRDNKTGGAESCGPVTAALSASHAGGDSAPCVAFKESQSGARTGAVHATLDANKGSRRMEGAIIGMQVRRLTPTECSRLQGFPDDWLEGLGFSDSTKYKMLGNAVCQNVSFWIATRLMAEMRREQTNRENHDAE